MNGSMNDDVSVTEFLKYTGYNKIIGNPECTSHL